MILILNESLNIKELKANIYINRLFSFLFSSSMFFFHPRLSVRRNEARHPLIHTYTHTHTRSIDNIHWDWNIVNKENKKNKGNLHPLWNPIRKIDARDGHTESAEKTTKIKVEGKEVKVEDVVAVIVCVCRTQRQSKNNVWYIKWAYHLFSILKTWYYKRHNIKGVRKEKWEERRIDWNRTKQQQQPTE